MAVILVPYPKPDYVEALKKAGAEVRTVSAGDASSVDLHGVDGVLLTGGHDIDPSRYAEERHPATLDAEPGRDDLEIALARQAIDARLPLFAICRGLQVLNVAAGGSLVQDIPSEIGHLVEHDVREPKNAEAHPVRVKPGSALAEALADEINEHGETIVNSRHHQAIGKVAPGLEVTAVAPDGLPEAVERAGQDGDGPFCVGVQWHPENFHESGRFRGLFEAFVGSAREAREAREKGRGR
jgi:putative glutamine amidotransferase